MGVLDFTETKVQSGDEVIFVVSIYNNNRITWFARRSRQGVR